MADIGKGWTTNFNDKVISIRKGAYRFIVNKSIHNNSFAMPPEEDLMILSFDFGTEENKELLQTIQRGKELYLGIGADAKFVSSETSLETEPSYEISYEVIDPNEEKSICSFDATSILPPVPSFETQLMNRYNNVFSFTVNHFGYKSNLFTPPALAIKDFKNIKSRDLLSSNLDRYRTISFKQIEGFQPTNPLFGIKKNSLESFFIPNLDKTIYCATNCMVDYNVYRNKAISLTFIGEDIYSIFFFTTEEISEPTYTVSFTEITSETIETQTDEEVIDATTHKKLEQELDDLQLELKGEKQMSKALKDTYSQKVASLQNLLKTSEDEIKKLKLKKKEKENKPPHRQLYFGEKEKPILIEKNWKAWFGDPAKLEADLKNWNREALKNVEENQQLRKEIADLKLELVKSGQNLLDKEKVWLAEKATLEHQRDANNTTHSKIVVDFNKNIDDTNKMLVYLGKHRATVKPLISDLESVKYWLRKKDKPMEELVDKDYYTLPELIENIKCLGGDADKLFNLHREVDALIEKWKFNPRNLKGLSEGIQVLYNRIDQFKIDLNEIKTNQANLEDEMAKLVGAELEIDEWETMHNASKDLFDKAKLFNTWKQLDEITQWVFMKTRQTNRYRNRK